jgi:indole-3-glycerol phosphate synthase/phosphoribosylanthranilate isomerase
MNIRDEIVEKRKKRIALEGHCLGIPIPQKREVPHVPFIPAEPFVICEIKRRSPSKGVIDENIDPAVQAGLYIAGGARNLSVLTEEACFGGSLADLEAVKKAHPEAAVLRKDFLVDEEDIDVSWRAGADAVLLIASVLGRDNLARLYKRALSLGMQALVEVYSPDDIEAVRELRPALAGINARNLETFVTDLLHPPVIKALIDWPCRTVFESGISGEAGARLAGELGFDGILVGEAAVRDPGVVPALRRGFLGGRERQNPFWKEIALRRRPLEAGRSLVKICGLTAPGDVRAAEDFGADILGFVFARSPRRAEPDFVAALPKSRALKVGVIVPEETEGKAPKEVYALLRAGALDAIQIHGATEKGGPADPEFPAYEVVRPANAEETLRLTRNRRIPRFLLDTYVPGMPGGTGRRLSPEILNAAAQAGPLWIAGGISPENVRDIVSRWKPELIDVSSGLEERPGKKDLRKMRSLFNELGRSNV